MAAIRAGLSCRRSPLRNQNKECFFDVGDGVRVPLLCSEVLLLLSGVEFIMFSVALIDKVLIIIEIEFHSGYHFYGCQFKFEKRNVLQYFEPKIKDWYEVTSISLIHPNFYFKNNTHVYESLFVLFRFMSSF